MQEEKSYIGGRIEAPFKVQLDDMIEKRYIASYTQAIELGIRLLYVNYKNGTSPLTTLSDDSARI